ncbi:MAG: phosphopantetheine-binding protein [Pseudomonas sp.]|uniref:phosphopantetheine-binding protein n=1 Tax=Pseudomonas sp. TaxID=306 RepID=UPI003BB5F24B
MKAETQVYALLEQPVLDPQASIFEQDGGSLRAVLLCARLQALWGTEIPLQLVFLHPQLADLVRVLKPYAGRRAY